MLTNSIPIYTSAFLLEMTYLQERFFCFNEIITSGPKSKSFTVGMTGYSFKT